MKHLLTYSILIGAIIGLLIMNLYFYSLNKRQNNLIKAYSSYYNNTERLLDDLDSAYNWVDGYDNYEYYSSKAKIDSLKQQ